MTTTDLRSLQLAIFCYASYSVAMDTSVEKTIEDFFSHYRTRKYAKGQILIFNGDTPEDMFQILSGRVKQYDVNYHGDEIILNVFKSPAFFPMSMAINKAPNPYTYEAETDIEIRQVPAQEVIVFLKENPDVLFDLLSRVYRGVDGLLAKMVHLMSGSAKARLMYELLVACRRFGTQQDDGSYVLAMHETDLGSRAGLSRETVSREMRKLEKEVLLSLTPGRICISDLSVFEKKLSSII